MATTATAPSTAREVPITCDPEENGIGKGTSSHPWLKYGMFHGGLHGPRFPPPPPPPPHHHYGHPPHHFGPPPFHCMPGGPPIGPRMNELSMHFTIDPRPDQLMDMSMDPRMGMDPRGFHGGPFHRPPMSPPFNSSHDPIGPFGRPPPPFGPPTHHQSSDDLSDENLHRCPFKKDWWKNAETCPWIQHRSSGKKVSNDDKEFKVNVNVSQFRPEDLNVSVTDKDVIVHGRHEEREDSRGFFTSRAFTRRYQLPDDVDPSTVKSSIDQDGMLSVSAPRKNKTENASSGCDDGREVPIEVDPAESAKHPEADN